MCECGKNCCSKKWLYYNNDTPNQYTGNKTICLDDMCNGYFVNNTGTSVCKVNGMPIQPGQSYTSGGNAGEIYIARFVKLEFLPGGANSAWVQQKFYVKGPTFDNKVQ
jgi:hypothetical protein